MNKQSQTDSKFSDTSRVLIQANGSESEAGTHPSWRGGRDEELTSSPFESESESANDMSEINARLERLLEKAPSDSSANLLLRKTKTGYKALLRVRSAHQKFNGFISGRRLIDVVERVLRDVKTQIDDWKDKRHLVDESV